MPVEICPKCGARVSFSKLDTLEKVHTCTRKMTFETKPVVDYEYKESDEKDVDNEGTYSDNRTSKKRSKTF